MKKEIEKREDLEFENERIENENVENESVENEEEKVLSEEELDAVFNTDEAIKKALEDMEHVSDPSTNFAKNESKKQKKPLSAIADEVVNNFLTTRSETDWKRLQEFFWYGIKQFAFKIINNWEDAYDMTIDTFIRAYEAIDSYDPQKARFSTWLWRICRNNCLHFIAQKKKLPVVNNDISDIYDSEMFDGVYTQDVDDLEFKISGDNQWENILPNEIAERLYNVSLNEIKNVGGLGQQILEMKLLKDMKIREIADRLNMNESTVKNYLYRSKENLSRLIIANHKELYDMYIDAKAVQNFEY